MLKSGSLNRSSKETVSCGNCLRHIYVIASIIAIFSMVSLTPAIAAQKPKQNRTAQSQTKESSREPTQDNADISISGSVRARELRFEIVPNQKVEFSGTHKRDTESKDERKNLPESVQPGVTYRNIEIRFNITSMFSDIGRVVSELLRLSSATEEKADPIKRTSPPQQVMRKMEGGVKQ
jgi:hypothetical protein